MKIYTLFILSFFACIVTHAQKAPIINAAITDRQIDRQIGLEEELAPWNLQEIGCSWYCGAYYDTKTSSFLTPSGKNKYDVSAIFDDDTRTAWVEGVKGYGIGEYIEFTFEYTAARATHCYLLNGYNKNDKTWQSNSRVKTFNIYEDDQLLAIVNLEDSQKLQEFELPHPVPNRPENFNRANYSKDPKPNVKLKFVITEVYKGDKYDDTAISELFFSGMDVHCLAEGTQITMAEGTLKAIETIVVGDNIKVYDTEKKRWTSIAVKQIHTVKHRQMLKITLDSGASIVATDDHPFWTTDGWQSFNPQKTKQYKRYASTEIKKYDVSSKIWSLHNELLQESTITSIEIITTPTQTYTLELEGEGSFIANEILVGQE